MSMGIKRSLAGRWTLRLAAYAGLAALLFSCSGNKYEGRIIAVELAGQPGSLEGARLVMLDPARPETGPVPLVTDFSATASPSLSHEGRYLYFQGKQQEGDPWQINVMDLQKGTVTRVSDLPENCTHPASLPDGSVVFSRESQISGTSVQNLWKCMMDGCCLSQLTHTPAINTLPSVLWEGRIMYSSAQALPETGDPQLMIMRPDGTKSELYSPGCCGLLPQSAGSEADGYIYYIVSGGQLGRVLHRRPLHTFENLSGNLGGSFASVSADAESGLLVSHLPDGESTYGIYRLDPSSEEKTPEVIYSGEKNLVDAMVVAVADPRPRILPSPVDPSKPTAILMTQNINHSSLAVNEGITGDSLADRVRFTSLDGELGIVEAKDDGSYYVKLDADMPFRTETLNSQGEVVRGPSEWIYLRPNERRAFTGFYADPELAPRNYQPHAVKEDPVDLSSLAMDSGH
jgi:hypothetical protein